MRITLAKYLPFKWGTIVTPKHLAGKRRLFYRGKDSQHRPVRDYLKRAQTPRTEKRTAILMPPKHYRDLISRGDPSFKTNSAREINSLPFAMKTILFEEHHQFLLKFMLRGIKETGFCWRWTKDGIVFFSLRMEFQSQTVAKTEIQVTPDTIQQEKPLSLKIAAAQ